MRVVLASKNPEKRAVLAAILAETAPGVELVGADWDDVEETGDTFEANAILKARAVHTATGLLALADDSGLEVDALGGEPGVRSARYGGVSGPGADLANNRCLLERMATVADRRCRFRCVIAVVGDGVEETVSGSVEGTLAGAPAGEGGFGYDPLFVPDGWDRTFAEADPREKAAVSHRGRALRAASRALARLATGAGEEPPNSP